MQLAALLHSFLFFSKDTTDVDIHVHACTFTFTNTSIQSIFKTELSRIDKIAVYISRLAVKEHVANQITLIKF